MIPSKSAEELEIMIQGGKILAEVKRQLISKVAPGITGKEIDQLATKLILGFGAKVSFSTEPGYHWATCIDINDGVVHGIPSDYEFKDGDLVGIDVGVLYRGFHTDTAVKVGVGKISAESQRFLESGQQALNKALAAVRAGHKISDISRSIESTIRKAGFRPVASLSGHGVGQKLHEDPLIPCVLTGDPEKSPVIKPGMALAIEVIYALGSGELAYGGPLNPDGTRGRSDGWTIVSHDGKITAAFEDTVILTEAGPRVITR